MKLGSTTSTRREETSENKDVRCFLPLHSPPHPTHRVQAPLQQNYLKTLLERKKKKGRNVHSQSLKHSKVVLPDQTKQTPFSLGMKMVRSRLFYSSSREIWMQSLRAQMLIQGLGSILKPLRDRESVQYIHQFNMSLSLSTLIWISSCRHANEVTLSRKKEKEERSTREEGKERRTDRQSVYIYMHSFRSFLSPWLNRQRQECERGSSNIKQNRSLCSHTRRQGGRQKEEEATK